MIVTCPSCATRTNFQNALRAPGNVKITCRSCGHKWIEIEDDDIVDLDPYRRPLDSLPRPMVQEADEVDRDVQRLLDAARETDEAFLAQRQSRRRAIRNWAGYGACLMGVLASFTLFPEAIVGAAPAAIRAYDALGVGVNVYGLEIRQVEQQHAIIKGVRVLTIKGDIINVTDDVRKIPWLRFGMRDVKAAEVYHWTLDTEARPLKPGEATSFVTRVAAPPESASDVEIRFAHETETGTETKS
jgi:zinc-ribbon domain